MVRIWRVPSCPRGLIDENNEDIASFTVFPFSLSNFYQPILHVEVVYGAGEGGGPALGKSPLPAHQHLLRTNAEKKYFFCETTPLRLLLPDLLFADLRDEGRPLPGALVEVCIELRAGL